jgi:LPXTG-motif cell wall-anchored protein
VTTAPADAPDPAIASTGSASAVTAAFAGFMLALGGLCIGMGRKRQAARA